MPSVRKPTTRPLIIIPKTTSLSTATASFAIVTATTPSTPSSTCLLRRWRLGTQLLYGVGAADQIVHLATVSTAVIRVLAVVEAGVVLVNRVVGASQLRADRHPTRPQRVVVAKHVQAATAQAEVLDDLEDLLRLVGRAVLLLFTDDDVEIDVGVDEVSIRATSHSTLWKR